MRRLLLLLLCVLLGLFAPSCGGAEKDPLLVLRFLDVGQGDCSLIETPEGYVLIDAGPEESQELLCLRLRQLGITRIELAVFSHADEDHIGGADGVLSEIEVGEVWLNTPIPDTPAGRLLQEAIERQETVFSTVCVGQVWQLGDLVLSVLAPLNPSNEDGNENSLVVRLQYRDVSALFSGDAGVEQERALLAAYGKAQIDCDLYKVGHHGSRTSSCKEFVEEMSPDFAVISCGAGNSFGHPMGVVLETLQSCGAEVLRTDLDGELIFESDGESLWRKEEKRIWE